MSSSPLTAERSAAPIDTRPLVVASDTAADPSTAVNATVAAALPYELAAPGFVPLREPRRRITSWTRDLLCAMRPHQWVKNLLVFVPIITARAIGDLGGWADAALMFAAFSCAASGIYLVNDLCDLDADRLHPKKRDRPFASGTLPLYVGFIAAPLLLLAGAVFAAAAAALPVLACYAAMSIAYSFYLKSQALIDVFLLAALYTIRMIGGGLASGHHVSLWLLAFSSFMFLSLAIVKRVAELQSLNAAPNRISELRGGVAGKERNIAGRGYRLGDRQILELMGVASSFVTSLVLALYVQSELSPLGSHQPTLAWGIVPLILFWQCRIWLVTARGQMHHDPVVFAARDWVSWLVAAGSFAMLLLDGKFAALMR
jgi:4-hydroxybenzoate polyprenyltransferase